MNRLLLLPLLAVLLLASGCATTRPDPAADAVPGRQGAHAFEREVVRTVGADYLLYLPEGYGEARQEWPLLLFLHGAGERGDDLELVKKHGPPKIVEERDLPFIVVSPQAPEDGWWDPDVLTGLLDEVEARYRVDSDRIYVTGLSMGGFGTWDLAGRTPERFAAIAPIAGGGNRRTACRLEDLPIWAFHGARDEVVPVARTEEMAEAVRACGGDPVVTIYPEAGHDSWTETYDDPELYRWLLQHSRSGERSSPEDGK